MRKAAWVLGLLTAFCVHASSPELVHDIYTGSETESSNPERFFSNGRAAYFFANDGGGAELWTTDGTPEGTHMVAELTPGDEPRYVDGETGGFVASGDLVWFWYPDPFDGDELQLWRTDGTRDGTFAVARELGRSRGDLAPIGAHGIVARSSDRFVSSDGTMEGTRFVLDEDLFNLYPRQIVAFRGLVYFIAGRELWRTDGTQRGTSLVGGFDDDFGDPRQLVAGDDAVYVLADSATNWEPYYVWRSDGSQPVLVTTFHKHPNDAPRMITSGGTVYALVGVEETNTEIWRLGTSPVRVTVVPGDTDSYTFLQAAGSSFYFATEKPDTLWRSDGTAAGTRIFEGVDVSQSVLLARSRVFTLANDGVYVSDGTRSTKITSRQPHAYEGAAAAIGDLLVLVIDDDQHGDELWVSDGTAQGTRLLKNIRADRNSYGASLVRLGNRLLFRARTESDGFEPWVSDGTLFGTHLLADVVLRSGSSYPSFLTPLPNGRAVFVGDRRLYGTDGTNTEMLRLTSADVFGTQNPLQQFPVIDGRAWLIYEDDDGLELWSADGTRGGMQKLMDLTYRPDGMIAVGRILYFFANDALWRTDGTAAGTFAVASNPEQMHAAGNHLFFIASTAAHGRELWVTDGTVGGTHIVRDIRRGEEGAFPVQYPFSDPPVVMESAGNVLFFAADDGVHGVEPWRSDGTEAGTYLLGDIAPGEASSMLPMFEDEVTAYADGSVFFGADDGVHGYELWRSDLQHETDLVRDISPGRGSSGPTHMRAIGDLVYFSADDARHGRELWWASPANAGLVADVNRGPDSSHPREMTALGADIYFFAITPETGDELWRVAPPQARHRAVR
jgi:ELWxxDGT repeat protein